MGNLTIELELVNSATDCLINPDDYDEADTGIADNLRLNLLMMLPYPLVMLQTQALNLS